jgi:L-lactate dehydrogenase
MKVGVVGAGGVGAATVLALAARGSAREVVLVNRTRARARAVAADVRYGTPLSPRRIEVRDGGFEDLAGASLVLLTAGVNERGGGATDRSDPRGRLRLLERNAEVYRALVPSVVEAAPEAVLLVVTDPPDPLTDLAAELAGHDRVFGTGTYLDSLRFRVHLAAAAGVSPADVEAQVLGEHGTSEVFVWSRARIAGVPAAAALDQLGGWSDARRRAVEDAVRFANLEIIEGNGASLYGVGLVCARLAEMVLRDERAVVPVGSPVASFGVTLSLPTVVGAGGPEQVLLPALAPDEAEALRQSAEQLRSARSAMGEAAPATRH